MYNTGGKKAPQYGKTTKSFTYNNTKKYNFDYKKNYDVLYSFRTSSDFCNFTCEQVKIQRQGPISLSEVTEKETTDKADGPCN